MVAFESNTNADGNIEIKSQVDIQNEGQFCAEVLEGIKQVIGIVADANAGGNDLWYGLYRVLLEEMCTYIRGT